VELWKNIRKGWETLFGFARFEVGDGVRTKFWHNLWCGDMVLKEVFPHLFGIAWVKDASVVDNMEVLDGSTQWNVSFVREGHDWEVGVFASFFQVLHSAMVSRDRADRLWWVSSKDCSRSSLSSSLWLALMVDASLGRVCGRLRLGWASVR
jgi:hypothetical protein